jgi:hypothetical protein
MVLATSGGGGAIQVEPGSLEAAASAISQVAADASGAEGSFSSARGGPGACDPRAAGACEAMVAAFSRQLSFLQAASSGLSTKVLQAANAYQGTDANQMGGGGAPPDAGFAARFGGPGT